MDNHEKNKINQSPVKELVEKHIVPFPFGPHYGAPAKERTKDEYLQKHLRKIEKRKNDNSDK